LPGLLASIAYNESHRELGVWLFEIGKVFRRPLDGEQLPDEREVVAAALAGADAAEAVTAWRALVDGLLLDHVDLLPGTTAGLHPTRSTAVLAADHPAGWLGEGDPAVLAGFGITERVACLQLDLEVLLQTPHGPGLYVPISRQPSSDIDLAFEVDESTPAGEVARTLRGANDLVAGVRLFDVYRGDQVGAGRRSLAYTVRLQAPDRTLTDDDIGSARLALIAAVERAHDASLRG
jgi:phenylalanyl-tRNA synthetase beta chain